MGKPNRSTSAPCALKDTETQLDKNIPELSRTQQSGNHKALQASQALTQDSHRSGSNSQMDGDGSPDQPPSLLDLQNDLQNVNLDIKHTLTLAISELKSDIHSMTHCHTKVEQTSQTHTEAIRQIQRAYDSQLPHILDLHHQVEDLDNQGRRHNIRRGSLRILRRQRFRRQSAQSSVAY